MWAALRAVALPLQGARVSFPKSSAALAMNQARLSEEQGCWSCVCVSGGRQARNPAEAGPLQAGAPCWRPPDCARSLWPGGRQHRTPGPAIPSQRRAPLPWESVPREGVTREQELLQGRMLRACRIACAPGLSSCQGPGESS